MVHAIGRFSAVFGVFLIGSLAVTAGQTAPQGSRQAAGQPQPTFTKDVAPILYKNCTTCHRPGEIAPMSLLTFEQARPWARAIKDNVVKGVMPPWHADPAHGTWRNERRLTAQEKDVITRWVDAGAPQGNPKDLPPQPTYTEGWSIGQPDAVVTMETAYQVPAEGEVAYQYFSMPTGLTEDKWVQAMEIRPGDRSVVHHVLVYARPPQITRRPPAFRPVNIPGPLSPTMQREMEEAKNNPRPPQQNPAASRGPLFAQVGAGTNPTIFAPGTAMLLPAGTVLTFQIHYTTNGKPTADKTRIGFKFASQAPASEVRPAAMVNPRFMIPAEAANHPVESGLEFLEDVTIYSLTPHTHLRGKTWEYRITYPDGRNEVLLGVPTYDFNWQTEYVFATPLRVPKGAVIKAVATYDNSKANKANPDSTKDVYWGEQTWEEMQYTGIMYSVDKDRVTTSAPQQQ